MATFSREFPRAVHVLPLHGLRGVWQERALLGKGALAGRPTAALRATTSGIDAALGFEKYVHFYLLRQETPWEAVPILATQLGASLEPPFPHIALEFSTDRLSDDSCTICLWNIAVSRPQVNGMCRGGNWTRGTDLGRILDVWRAFRDLGPSIEKARGYWNGQIQVPTLRGQQIAEQRRLLGRAASGIPELLLPSSVSIDEGSTLWTFSEEDKEIVIALGDQPGRITARCHLMQSYQSRADRTRAWRNRIEAYFTGVERFPADLDFDRKR